MTTAAVIQSNYIPWKGYFDVIHDVDLFIFYDDVQFTKNDWRNRNKIKTRTGLHWLSVPVGQREDRLICDVEINQPGWEKKHLATLTHTYSRSAHFAEFREFLEEGYGREWTRLSELNRWFIEEISRRFLGINARFEDSRTYTPSGQKQDRLLDLLQKAGTTRYISGPAAKAYIDPATFEAAGIELVWKDYSGYPEYNQLYPPFEHGVSILDLLFNTGMDAPKYIWGWRRSND